MKITAHLLSASAVAALTVAVFALTTIAQPPQAPGSGGPPPQAGGPSQGPRNFPAPTNLKVLPKNLSGAQVRDIMEQWEGSLGAHCNTCHAEDPKNLGPNGRPRLNFADDSKEEKLTARLMYKMTEDIGANYISKVPNSDIAITCGTCHRGHLDPEPFVIPKEEHGGPPTGPPPAGTPPPAQH